MQMTAPSPGELIEAGDILIMAEIRKALESLTGRPTED
jgi:hypothetical protein